MLAAAVRMLAAILARTTTAVLGLAALLGLLGAFLGTLARLAATLAALALGATATADGWVVWKLVYKFLRKS